MNLRRRGFIRNSVLSAGALSLSGKTLAAQLCTITPEQTSGPFYPGEEKFEAISDLTRVPGSRQRASGQVIYVSGVVTDPNCQPIPGVQVELWQACVTGKYNHSSDPNEAPLDPHFRYWAEATTDNQGRYLFKTIKPGAYPASQSWDRPPHLHFRFAKRGYRELVTQMYFKGEALNEIDLILQDHSPSEQAQLVVDFLPVGADMEPGALIGEFTTTLGKF